jgi:hypothetical protein
MSDLRFIPVMDAQQYLWEVAVNAANALTHSPPAYQRTVYGMVSPMSDPDGYVTVPLGSIGYDAASRLVLMGASGAGGIGSVSMRCPCAVSSIVKMLCLLPWDLRGENEDYNTPPSVDEIKKWMLDQIRDALNLLKIRLPEVPSLVFAPPKGAPGATVGDMLASTVPALDALQFAWQTAINAANALPHHPPIYTQDIEADVGEGVVKVGMISYDAAKREVRLKMDDEYGSGLIVMRTNAVVWFTMQLILLLPFNLPTPVPPTTEQIQGFVMGIVNDVFDALGWPRPFPFAPTPPPKPPALPVPQMPKLPDIKTSFTPLIPDTNIPGASILPGVLP